MTTNILVVDDEPKFLDLFDINYKKQIQKKKYSFRKCLSGKDALESISKNKPDLILLDLIMPAIDGFELAEQINKKQKFDIPIIIISTKAIPENYSRGMKIRAYDFINKNTLDFDELEQKIEDTLLLAEHLRPKKAHSSTVLKELKSLDSSQKFKVISKVIESDLNLEQIQTLQEELPGYAELAKEQKRQEESLRKKDLARGSDEIPLATLEKALLEITDLKYKKADGTISNYNYLTLRWPENGKSKIYKLKKKDWADPILRKIVMEKLNKKQLSEKDKIAAKIAISKLERKKH